MNIHWHHPLDAPLQAWSLSIEADTVRLCKWTSQLQALACMAESDFSLHPLISEKTLVRHPSEHQLYQQRVWIVHWWIVGWAWFHLACTCPFRRSGQLLLKPPEIDVICSWKIFERRKKIVQRTCLPSFATWGAGRSKFPEKKFSLKEKSQ